MKSAELVHAQIVYSQRAFADPVLGRVPTPGKGARRHFGAKESEYGFTTPDVLLADFHRDIPRRNRENRNA